MVMVNAIVLFKSYCSCLSRMTVTKVLPKFDYPKKAIPQTTDLLEPSLEPPTKPGTSDPVAYLWKILSRNLWRMIKSSQFVTND
jgi:hypothetical protein